MYNKIKKILQFSPYIFHIIYFNFHYFPFKQAIKLPVFLYKPKFLKLKGKIVIQNSSIKTGMIRLGQYGVSLYPNTGIVWENLGGDIFFKGQCSIGNASAISVGKNGCIIFGENFASTAALKIASYNRITFGDEVLVGWDNLFIDTDFHQTKSLDGMKKASFGEISIGNNNWFGVGCVTLKNASTTDNTIVSGKSLLNKIYSTPNYSVIGGVPAKLISTGIYRDPNDDIINYNV